jgi:hypothetical protein
MAAMVAGTAVVGVVQLVPERAEPKASPAGGRTAAPTTPAAITRAPGPVPDPAAIVDDPRARIVSSSVRVGDPAVRSVVWQLCRTPRCRWSDHALAVTADGFASRRLVPLSRDVVTTPLDGVFLLGTGLRARIVQPDGSLTPVDWDARPAGPVLDDEQLVGVHRFGRLHAVDTVTGAGHRVAAPPDLLSVVRDGDGRLRGRMRDPLRLAASADAGRTWVTSPAPAVMHELPTDLVASASTARAMVSGGDGATFLPFELVHGSHDAGETWTAWEQSARPMAYVGMGLAVLPDGRLLADLVGGGNPNFGRVGRQPNGLWVSAGKDWSDLAPVTMGAPFETLDLHREFSPVHAVEVTRDAVTIYAVTSTPHQTLWASTDAGTTWREVASR